MSRRLPIAHLKEKLDYLARGRVPGGIGRHLPNQAGLAELIGVYRTTLRDQLVGGALSAEVQEKLAKLLHFSPEWAEWEHGTSKEFADRYERSHAQPSPTNVELATIELFAMQDGANGFAVGVDIICQPVSFDGIVVAIRRALLELDFGPNQGPTLKDRAGYPEPLELDSTSGKSSVRLSIANSRSSRPMWHIEAKNQSIGAVSVSDSHPLARINPPTELTAKLSVSLKDLEIVGPGHSANGDATNAQSPADKLEVVRPSSAKEAIARIMSWKALEAPEDGRIVVATHTLQVVPNKS